MNPGIFYLYEYNNKQKLRNVGFLKLTRYYHSCTLQLNARGIPVTHADTLKLCAFYLENDSVGATVLAEVSCANHMVTARLKFAECQFPDGHTLNTMDGFFLPLSNGRILAASVPGILVDANKLLDVFKSPPAEKKTSPPAEQVPEAQAQDVSLDHDKPLTAANADACTKEETSEPQDHSADAEEPRVPGSMDTRPDQEEIVPDTDNTGHNENAAVPGTDNTGCNENAAVPDRGNAECNEDAAVPDTDNTGCDKDAAVPDTGNAASDDGSDHGSLDRTPPDNDTCAPDSSGTNPSPGDNPPDNMDTEAAESSSRQKVQKIQRSDMSILPRHYWHLANNSFLLHGYHNYSHLLLVEEDGHYWLGVPGIYDSREARAARLFGFPQFTDSYNEQLDLSEEEKNNHGTFGYWCCFLK